MLRRFHFYCQRNQSLAVIMCGKEEVLKNFAFAEPKTYGQANALKRTVENVANISISSRVAQCAVQKQRNATFCQAVEELLILEDILKRCRESDPGGIYMLQTSKLAYELPFELEKGTYENKMFDRLHVIPSASKHFWSKSRCCSFARNILRKCVECQLFQYYFIF